MKHRIRHRVFMAALMFLSLSSVISQESKLRIAGMSGDSADCGVYLSSYREFMKIKYYEEAREPWTKAFEKCPGSSLRLYVDGTTLYRNFIENSPEGPVREGMIDTLLLIYDRRMENFGDEGNVLGRKGKDLLAYRGEDIGQVQRAYEMLGRSIDIEGNKSSESVLLLYLTAGIALGKAGQLEEIRVLDDYIMLSGMMDQLEEMSSRWKKTRAKLDEMALREGLLSCEALDSYYTAQSGENMMDTAYLENAVALYQISGCNRSDFYATAFENLHRMDPSPESAHRLGILFITRGDNEKAAGYLTEAVREEGMDSGIRAQWYYELALVSYALENYCEAIEHARNAVGLKEDFSAAYILLGDAYIASRGKLGDDFQQRAAYWAAVDQYQKAVRVDPSVEEKTRQKLDTSRGQYPDAEDVFFQDLKDGDTYRVGGCINENTIVRSVE